MLSEIDGRVVLYLADPDGCVSSTKDGLIVSLGLEDAGHRALLEGSQPFELRAEAYCRQFCDATILRIGIEHEHATVIQVWKGLTSTYEMYFHLGPDGRTVLSDHFRNVLAELPVADRRLPERALLDHLLFRTVFCPDSYVDGIDRAAHSERLDIDPRRQTVTRSLLHRPEFETRVGTEEHHIDAIEAALEQTLQPFETRKQVANCFSGGVDSTLLQTFLRGSATPVNVVSDTPEFALERDYATRAAELLGEKLVRPEMREAAYLEDLVTGIKAMAIPPNHESVSLGLTAYSQPYSVFLVGQFAGSIFGKDGSHKSRIAWHLRGPLGSRALQLGSRSAPRSVQRRLRALDHVAQGFRVPFGHPFGHAGRHCVFSDLPHVEALMGREKVEARLQQRLDYTRERVSLAAPNEAPLIRHLELDQWIEIFSDQMLPDRHLANALGKSVRAPFCSGPMLSAALAVPVSRRYLKGLTAKYLLKAVMRRRLPAYPLRQKKLPTALPFERFYRSGPLSGVWDRYPVPDVFTGELRRSIIERPTWLTWNAITLSIWQEEVLKNPHLEPIPSARAWRLPL